MGEGGKDRPVVYSYTELISFFICLGKNVKSKDKTLNLHKKNRAPKKI